MRDTCTNRFYRFFFVIRDVVYVPVFLGKILQLCVGRTIILLVFLFVTVYEGNAFYVGKIPVSPCKCT